MGDSYNIEKIYKYLFYLQNLNVQVINYFYYKRKYDKFLQRINHPSYDKYKQVQTISSSIE